jgi:hypothetical protein
MSYLTVGFTGTREGMSLRQRDLLREILQRTPPQTFHHGAAIGADHEAVSIVEAWCPRTTIVAHPAGPNPLTRNRAIVAAVELLIAAPRSNRRTPVGNVGDGALRQEGRETRRGARPMKAKEV